MHEMSKEQQLYLKTLKKQRLFVVFSQIFLLILFLCLWEISSRLQWIDSFIFSSPSKIFNCFIEMLLTGSIFAHLFSTLKETVLSFVLVTFFGIFTAVLLWYSKRLSEILDPYLVVLNSLPKSALAPLLIVWLGANQFTIVTAGMSVAIFGSICIQTFVVLTLKKSLLSIHLEAIAIMCFAR